MKAESSGLDTRDQLVELATELVEARGYNAFSFRELSERVGIRTASIHYHFPTKADLGRAIVIKHRQDNAEFHDRLDREGGTTLDRLKRFFDAFRAAYSDGPRICLAAMMATDSESLAPEVLDEVRHCYTDHERWLAQTLAEGRRRKELDFAESPTVVARAMFDALEGSLIAARALKSPQRIHSTIQWCLRQLAPR